MNKTITYCAKCVLPNVNPDFDFDTNGVCKLCREMDSSDASKNEKLLETDFLKIISKYKGKHKYDCLVMCSGGKDSTAALYYAKKRYHLNVLAFMFDHGFESKEAIQNVERATQKLGVDFIYFKTMEMKTLFSAIIKEKSKALICHPCSIWYMDLAYDIAKKNDAPIIIAGWTKGQVQKSTLMSKCGCSANSIEFREMSLHSNNFLKKFLDNNPNFGFLPSTLDELLKKNKKNKRQALVLSPHWFLEGTAKDYVPIIKNELGWIPTVNSYPLNSTNCELNFLSVHNALKYFGYTHYHVEFSKMIRDGLLSRDEAISNLNVLIAGELLAPVLTKLGHTLEDLENND